MDSVEDAEDFSEASAEVSSSEIRHVNLWNEWRTFRGVKQLLLRMRSRPLSLLLGASTLFWFETPALLCLRPLLLAVLLPLMAPIAIVFDLQCFFFFCFSHCGHACMSTFHFSTTPVYGTKTLRLRSCISGWWMQHPVVIS